MINEVCFPNIMRSFMTIILTVSTKPVSAPRNVSAS